MAHYDQRLPQTKEKTLVLEKEGHPGRMLHSAGVVISPGSQNTTPDQKDIDEPRRDVIPSIIKYKTSKANPRPAGNPKPKP